MLSRFRSEALIMFRRVYAREANGVSKTARIERVHSVAISDADDFGGELIRIVDRCGRGRRNGRDCGGRDCYGLRRNTTRARSVLL